VALPDEEWLPLAKRLAVGAKNRVHHRSERRPNMVVGHEQGYYWSYCQACKEGGRRDKDHVRLVAVEPARSRELSLPSDLVEVRSSSETLRAIGAFLARKHMDFAYLPEMYFSRERMRLLLRDYAGNYFGRDLTERSPQKWLHYKKVDFASPSAPQATTALLNVIVEDLFSAYKIQWAMSDTGVHVYCSLGTRISDSLMLRLTRAAVPACIMYDGDGAGIAGADYELPRLRSFGLPVRRISTPLGFDPKDLTIDQLRQLIGEVLSTL
jgi:hypothetical protein